MKRNRIRLDTALQERGLTESRAKAQALIMARRVVVNGVVEDKPGKPVEAGDLLAITELEHPWVGRGGIKLAHALKAFNIDVREAVCADIGASTGGFTHVLLTHGAARVHAIDVGYGQLDQSLRNDPRVVNRERVNARYLQSGALGEDVDLITIDVSFIPLQLILPAAVKLLRPRGRLIALIKPQFQVGREGVGKGGIVRDATLRGEAVERVRSFAESIGLEETGLCESPITGAEGNIEYLIACTFAWVSS